MTRFVFLTGMPGAGKSHWGKCWAAAHSWQHIDIDDEIERTAGVTIAQLFEQVGEAAFRVAEQEALSRIISFAEGDIIVSCGGGTPAFFNNLEQMLAAGCMVYLKASTDQLLQHLSSEGKERPLLRAGNVAERLEGLLLARSKFYEQASVILSVESLTEATFAEILARCTNRH